MSERVTVWDAEVVPQLAEARMAALRQLYEARGRIANLKSNPVTAAVLVAQLEQHIRDAILHLGGTPAAK